MELKSFKIRVTEKQSVYVQNEVFRNGGGWNGGGKSIEISNYLFYESEKKALFFCDNEAFFNEDELQEITFGEFFDMIN